jgi:hypothetical protein
MSAHLRQHLLTLGKRSAALFGLSVLFAGCGPPTAQQALKQAFLDNPKAQPVAIVPFEGTVTVDGKPPSTKGLVLLVILNDMKHPQDPGKPPKLRTGCDESGHFAFTTYEAHDGVQTGSYVVTFVQLHSRPNIGHRRNSLFKGPDELKNLYNDPDKNAEIPEFKIDLKMPGIKDAHFNLTVEGKEPVATPGPHAITTLDTR